MDDYLHFVEAHSLYLFRGGVLNPIVSKAWGLLRIVVVHYFRALLSTTPSLSHRRPASRQRIPCLSLLS